VELADRIAIENLVARYARCVDMADYAELGRMFAAGRITANIKDNVLIGGNRGPRFLRDHESHATPMAPRARTTS
jgi:hypothetical protein